MKRKGITDASLREVIFVILAIIAIFAIVFIALYFYNKIPLDLVIE